MFGVNSSIPYHVDALATSSVLDANIMLRELISEAKHIMAGLDVSAAKRPQEQQPAADARKLSGHGLSSEDIRRLERESRDGNEKAAETQTWQQGHMQVGRTQDKSAQDVINQETASAGPHGYVPHRAPSTEHRYPDSLHYAQPHVKEPQDANSSQSASTTSHTWAGPQHVLTKPIYSPTSPNYAPTLGTQGYHPSSQRMSHPLPQGYTVQYVPTYGAPHVQQSRPESSFNPQQQPSTQPNLGENQLPQPQPFTNPNIRYR